VTMATIYFSLILSNVFLPVVVIRWVAGSCWYCHSYLWQEYLHRRWPNVAYPEILLTETQASKPPLHPILEYLPSVFFRCVRKIAKSDYSFRHVCPSNRPSVRLSAWNNSVPSGRIFMKSDIRVYFKKLSRKFKSH
jgi:hypothetical protein